MSKIINIDSLSNHALISPHALKQDLPVTDKQADFIRQSRLQVRQILDGQDPRLLLIVGPCSIHDVAAAQEYAVKLKQLSDNVSKFFLVIMRAHFEKPRTALGWKGMLHDPRLDGSNDFAAGLRLSRELLLCLAELSLPAATEFLDPIFAQYFNDLITWGCIGARTSESQIHRQFASGLPMPVAFKNSTSGNIDTAINGVLAAACAHSYPGVNEHGNLAVIQTEGNSYAHIALRGGETKTNYDSDSLAYAAERLKKKHLPQNLVIDCSHDNSSRNPQEQGSVFRSVLHQYIKGNGAIKGLSLESNLLAGHQSPAMDKSRLSYGISITDPCMDWQMTEELIYLGKAMLEQQNLAETLKDNLCAQV